MSDALDLLVERVRACRLCVEAPAGRPLPHEPRPVLVASTSARVLIAGQAPGTKVHRSGLPFDDASGDRLRHWLGVDRDRFYDPRCFAIAPMGFCFPGQDAKGGDLPPRRECAPAWRTPLLALMPRVDLVVAVGRYAQIWHLGANCQPSLSATVEAWRAVLARPDTPKIFPLPHPSWRNAGWLRQNPWFETDLLPSLRQEIHARLDGGG